MGVVADFPSPCEVMEEVCLGASGLCRLVLKGGGTVVVVMGALL